MISKTAFVCVRQTVSGVVLSAFLAGAAVAQDATEAELQYSQVLQQIYDLKTSIAHQEVYIATQKERIADLQKQIEAAEGVKKSVEPMLAKMASAISDEIEKDIPFNAEERFARLGDFQDIVNDNEALPADKMRKALTIYEAEVGYGQSVQSYAGDHPVADKAGSRLNACRENLQSSACALTKDLQKRVDAGATADDLAANLKDGTYLRYGRLALAYSTADESEVYLYNQNSREWEQLKGGRALDVQRAVKMARGESAPGVIEAPVIISN